MSRINKPREMMTAADALRWLEETQPDVDEWLDVEILRASLTVNEWKEPER